VPVGMAKGPGNTLYVADEPGHIGGTDLGKVWRINLDSGQQSLLSSNNSTQGYLFNHPQDVVVNNTGDLFLVNGGNNGFAGTLFRVNAQTGVQSLVSFFAGSDHGGLDSLELGRDGLLYVGAIAYGNIGG